MTSSDTTTRHRPDPAATPPLPLTIAVLALPAGTPEVERRAARLDLALLAYKLGYFVIDTIEVTADDAPSRYSWIADLAEQTDADAFVCRGHVDRSRLDDIADRIHMVVRTVPVDAELG